jgi:hypothetical protein
LTLKKGVLGFSLQHRLEGKHDRQTIIPNSDYHWDYLIIGSFWQLKIWLWQF